MICSGRFQAGLRDIKTTMVQQIVKATSSTRPGVARIIWILGFLSELLCEATGVPTELTVNGRHLLLIR